MTADYYGQLAPALIAAGYLVVPIKTGEKRPAISGWQHARLTAEDKYPGHGVGVLCGQGDYPVVGVDIDISHPVVGPALIAWCEQHLGYTAARVGAAPRILLAYRAARAGWTKALSISFFDATDPTKPDGKRNDQRVEILGNGQQFVAYHVHPGTGRPYEWTDMMGGLEHMPAADLPLITEAQVAALLLEVERLVRLEKNVEIGSNPTNTGVTSSLNNSTDLAVWDDDLMSLSPRVGKTLAEVSGLLEALKNADDDYDTWMLVGMSLHHEFSNTPDEAAALLLWRAYGSKSSKDVPGQYEYKWRSFGKASAQPTTLRWLIKFSNESNKHLKYNAKTEWQEQITASADEFNLREKLCPQIAKDTRLDDMGREALAQMLFDAFKRLGTKYPIANCRKLLVEAATKAGGKKPVAAWMADWYYITDDDCFYRYDSEEFLTQQGFNARFNRELPRNEDDALTVQAAQQVLNDDHVPTVTRGMYLPWAGATFSEAGIACVNTYRPSTTPQPVAQLSAAGRAAVAVVTRHFDFLAGGRPEVVQTLIDWMAHNVQHPGVKIRWAPLWKGVEGDGKTVMGELMASVMGRVNVKNVSPKVLGTDFTGWAQGSALVVLEEIKLSGHNRYDILNALKPFITNSSIEIHRKGKDTTDSINTTNYIAFTNYGDALPLTDTDRRWWIVFTPFASSSEMGAAVAGVAGSLGAYFDTLHDTIAKHPAELRRWLLDHPISDGFKPNGSAPMTDEKALMVSSAMSDDEAEVREILEQSSEQKVQGVTPKLFSSRSMGDALVLGDTELSLATTSRNRLFSKCGFTKVPKKLKWKGEAHLIWFKGSTIPGTDAMRKLLDSTVCEKSQNEDLFADDLFGTL